MSERYSKLFALPENLYASGAPVVIAAGALLKDNQTGKVIAQLKMRNIGANIIKAVKVCIHPLDTVGNALGAEVEYQYLDLAAKRNEEFGAKSPIPLADAATRSYSVSVVEVVFTDNTVWNATDEPWEVLSAPPTLDAILKDSELLKQYRIKYGTDCRYSPTVQKDLWYCVCGELNRKHETGCHHCGKSIANLQAINIVALKAERDARIASEKQKAAEDKAAADAKAKKTKKLAIIITPIVVVLIVAAVLISNVVKKNQEEAARLEAYNTAVAMFEAGEYEEAIEAFTALGDYKDSAEQIQAAEAGILEQQKAAAYADAIALLEAGRHSEAYAAFSELDDYKEVQDYLDCFKMLPVKIDGSWAKTTLEYDNQGRIVEEITKGISDDIHDRHKTYSYDENSLTIVDVYVQARYLGVDLITTETAIFNTDRTQAHYTYSNKNWTKSYNRTFTYDEYGNVLTAKSVNEETGELEYNRKYVYEYDENGNVLSSYFMKENENGEWAGQWNFNQYKYTEAGELVTVEKSFGDVETYTYDYIYCPNPT